MRKIKFRAFLPIGEWTEDGESQEYEMCYDFAHENYSPINDHLTDTENLMQYIGLDDSHNAEIYEGDIVEYSYVTEDLKERFTVEYVAPCFKFRSHTDGKQWNISEYDFCNLKITGNIHEGANQLIDKELTNG